MAEGGECFTGRNWLRENESKVQKWWEDEEVFSSKPGDKLPEPGEKFFGNFPFPYMNGYLHLGHAFSLSKLEFAAAFHRLRGANVLLPFALHCTGMPIKAPADKLTREIQSKFKEQEADSNASDGGGSPIDNNIFKTKKSKAAAKSSRQVSQWEVMKNVGISESEISAFQHPHKWLLHFMPLAMKDLKAFGLGCDWRRFFIATDRNPCFDSFVKWQMRKLKSMGKVVKDVRYTIFSPLDGQPCADHDRATGEGAQPQEYTIIKMEWVPPFPDKFRVLDGRKVFLAAASFRFETLYGQTNAWVLPEGKYGAFEINESEVFVLSHRAALNLAYQNHSRLPQKPTCLLDITGHDLIGIPLKSPLSIHEIIHALPMLYISMDEGTGVLTSVPSDSPEDYIALHGLKSNFNSEFRAEYGIIKHEWLMPIVPIIAVPHFGDKCAETICSQMEIRSQNEKVKLAEAKKQAYLKGFTEGKMLVGEFAGMKVQVAQPLIRSKLLETGQAIVYREPEMRVMSRSGDECVVALTEQWYITYGESEWKKLAEECLSNMSLYSDETRREFEHTLSWLNQWPLSQSSGLGTRIPWDEQLLVESLSDSTIYMAYYTVAHYLHNGDLCGSSESAIKPRQLTDDVWDYIFCDGPFPKSTDISSSLLDRMKLEFEYWYPFDLRVSGKDLIQNHLTFCIYNHTAIMSKRHWPRGFRCNGHIMLNSEKMSNSTGNFETLRQAIERFSADATRFSLAAAGDGVDDSIFDSVTANAAILWLNQEIAWYEKILAAESSMRTDPPSVYPERIFANEINIAVKTTEKNYSSYMFREALKTVFYDLQAARDDYRFSCRDGIYNRELVWRFMDVQTRLLAPICPHYAEYIWRNILKKDGFVVKAGWPAADAPDLTLTSAKNYLQDTIVRTREFLQKHLLDLEKANKKVTSRTKTKIACFIYVSIHFDKKKSMCLKILQNKFNRDTRTFAPDEEISEAFRKCFSCKEIDEQYDFLRFKKEEAIALGDRALDFELPFSELDVLQQNLDLIKTRINVEDVKICSAKPSDSLQEAGHLAHLLETNPPFPGNPTIVFLTQQLLGLRNMGNRMERQSFLPLDQADNGCSSMF